MFHKNLFEILLSRLKVLINTKIFLDDFGLFSKPCYAMRIVHWVRPFRQGPEGSLVLQGKLTNSFFFNSKDSLTEFVLNKRSASHFTKLFLALRRWRKDKCVY